MGLKMLNRLIYFLLQRAIGSHVYKYYREFFLLERLDFNAMQRVQDERLAGLLQHASSGIPFYRERVPWRPTLSLADFPVLTKKDIHKSFYDLMTTELRDEYQGQVKRTRPYSWVVVKTGGSTGIPTTVIHDREFRDRGRAGRLYAQHLCGFPFGTPYLRLWGSMRDINQMSDSLAQRLTGFLARQTLLNAFRMGNGEIERYLDLINASSVNHMMAYVDAAQEMARYALKTGKKLKALQGIMACAGTVTEDTRRTLTEAFHARVHNNYGSRECATMACECESGGLHIFGNNLVLEVVDEKGRRLKAGQRGRILITLLFNHTFPLIRYDIGDEGTLSDQRCSCGRPCPLLEGLQGRRVEFLTDNAGGYVTPAYVIHLIGVVHNPGCIRRFQLVQTSPVDYELRLEVEPDTPEQILADITNKIRRDLRAVFGSQSRIEIRQMKEIPASDSGKFLYTINKMVN
jgi:phenylacetate-CoA ligase